MISGTCTDFYIAEIHKFKRVKPLVGPEINLKTDSKRISSALVERFTWNKILLLLRLD